MYHPIAESLERRWRQTSPYAGNVTVIERSGDIVQFIAHSYLSGQRLHTQIKGVYTCTTKLQQSYNSHPI